jgi:hypothetical protein
VISPSLLLILWVVLVLPSANFGRFNGLPFDTVPELIALFLLLPLTVSGVLRRYLWRLVGAGGRVVPAVLVLLGLVVVGGKLALFASGTYQGFLGCYRSTLVSPPTEPCERSFANPFFRYSATRIDQAIDFSPETWNLSFLNSRRFSFRGHKEPGRPRRDRLPIEVTWRGVVERPKPWVARATYIGEVTLRIDPGLPGKALEIRLPTQYGTTMVADSTIPAGRHLLEVSYLFDDGARWPEPVPVGPGATLRLESEEDRGASALVTAVPPAAMWRSVATIVDIAELLLGVAVILGYAALLRRDWWLITFVAAAGLAISRVDFDAVDLPIATGVFVALLVVGFTLLGRPWRRRLVLAFFAAALLNFCLVLLSVPRLDAVFYRFMPSDPLSYESQARTILETWSLEGGEPVFKYQPGFRYWRFLERLVLGDGDPFVWTFGLTVLTWGYLWAIGRLWLRPAPSWPRAVAFALGAGLLLALATSNPVVVFVETSLSEYPTWVLFPVGFILLFGAGRPRHWVSGGILLGLAALCRLNHILVTLGCLAVFVHQRRRAFPGAVALAVGFVLVMLTLPSLHNRYYGGAETKTLRLLGINRVAVVITPSRLAAVHNHPGAWREVLDQIRRILYRYDTRESFPQRDRFSRLTMWGLQWLWAGTAIVALSRRRLAATTKALLLVPLLYFVVHLVYTVEFYYPRHILAGHLALGVAVLYTVGRGWTNVPSERPPRSGLSSAGHH